MVIVKLNRLSLIFASRFCSGTCPIRAQSIGARRSRLVIRPLCGRKLFAHLFFAPGFIGVRLQAPHNARRKKGKCNDENPRKTFSTQNHKTSYLIRTMRCWRSPAR